MLAVGSSSSFGLFYNPFSFALLPTGSRGGLQFLRSAFAGTSFSGDLSLNWNVFFGAVGVPGTVLVTQGLFQVLSIRFLRINLFYPLNLLDLRLIQDLSDLVSPRVPA